MSLVFEWDPRKDRSNYRKHGISFAEALSVFSDPLARIFADEGHSAEEAREIIVGHSAARRLMLVCFTEPENRPRSYYRRSPYNQGRATRL